MHLKMYSTNVQEVEHHDVSHCHEVEFHKVPNFPPTQNCLQFPVSAPVFCPARGGWKISLPLAPPKKTGRKAEWQNERRRSTLFTRFRAETTNHHGHSNDKLVNSQELKIPHESPGFSVLMGDIWGTSKSRIESEHHIYNFLSWCEIPVGFDRINLTNQRDNNKTNETNGFSRGRMLVIFGRPT